MTANDASSSSSSSGGGDSVSGRLGQPDASAAPMTHGQHAVTGVSGPCRRPCRSPACPRSCLFRPCPAKPASCGHRTRRALCCRRHGRSHPSTLPNSPGGAANPAPLPASGPRKFYRLSKTVNHGNQTSTLETSDAFRDLNSVAALCECRWLFLEQRVYSHSRRSIHLV